MDGVPFPFHVLVLPGWVHQDDVILLPQVQLFYITKYQDQSYLNTHGYSRMEFRSVLRTRLFRPGSTNN
jgi:hypothetical protein